MSTNTTTAASPTSTASTSNTNYYPCVQYGFPVEKGPRRTPKLRTIFEPIPDDAITASPIYKVPQEQYERQDEFETGHEVKGESSIAKEIQDECEADDRVLYPIHIESDAYQDVGPETLISWFREFVEDYLEVSFNTCRLYFSGNRSIHVHVPRFVSGEANREQLKELAESFCEETGADLDTALYSRKRLFRLPGVEHEKSGLPKVEIASTWDHTRIFRKSHETNPSVSVSYADVLWDVFVQESLTNGKLPHSADQPRDLFAMLNPDETVLELISEGQEEKAEQENAIETPLIEQMEFPAKTYDVPEWIQYNGHQYSPYALAAGNPRSVAALEVKGGAFAREDKRNGAPMVPVRFFGAVGCNGQFTKETEHGPLQLSEGPGKDYEKWAENDFEAGDYVVIIGGQSRSSIIHSVAKTEALQVGYRLIREDGGRQDALTYLSEQGYGIGTSGSAEASASTSKDLAGKPHEIWPARESPGTKAEALQKVSEREGIENLSHNERVRVACRHLRYGWEPTWEWFEDQFGTQFKPHVTWEFLSGIVEDPDFGEYDHVEVPAKPS
ncbi:hypothetical protein [Halorhabdus sp. BNX81]|uniref:hypothetical protein n=1 Tax=Halorhabdus sp. BNX81 TaxID=2980181 RepID=UPI0023DD5C4C|nr:hypothetical protein [Halorhabdus sp. BNX81]WEL22679.1 hypothetical protein HBNXHr_2640 [Halorhabdus sp. BNX81]